MLVLKGLVGIHRTVQLKLLQHYWLGHRLGHCDIEWFALEVNRDHSVIPVHHDPPILGGPTGHGFVSLS